MKTMKKPLVIFSVITMLLMLAGIGYAVYYHFFIRSLFLWLKIDFENFALTDEATRLFISGAGIIVVALFFGILFAIIAGSVAKKVKCSALVAILICLALLVGGALEGVAFCFIRGETIFDSEYAQHLYWAAGLDAIGRAISIFAVVTFILLIVRAHMVKVALASEEAVAEELPETKEEEKVEEKPAEEKPLPVVEEVKEEPAKVEEEKKVEEPKVVEEKKEEEKPAPKAAKKAPKAEPKKEEPKKVEEKKAEEKPEPKKEEPKKEEKPLEAAPKAARKIYHISQHAATGKWQVKIQGSDKAIKLFDTQAECIEYTKQLAENQDGIIRLHSRKGTFRTIS